MLEAVTKLHPSMLRAVARHIGELFTNSLPIFASVVLVVPPPSSKLAISTTSTTNICTNSRVLLSHSFKPFHTVCSFARLLARYGSNKCVLSSSPVVTGVED